MFPKNARVSEASIRMVKVDGKVKSTLLSGEGAFLSHQNCRKSFFLNALPTGIEMQPDSIALGTLSAETIPVPSDFSVDGDEFDLDQPTVGFSSIREAIEDIRQGKVGGFFSFSSHFVKLKISSKYLLVFIVGVFFHQHCRW